MTRSRLLPLWAASILLAGIAVGVHFGTTSGQFTSWDDEFYVTGNTRIQQPSAENLAWFFTHPYFNSYTPIPFMSHALDWWLWGANPAGHHWHNLLLHGMNTVLLFWLALGILRRGLREPPPAALLVGAFAAALLFTVHPLRVESVAWISDRKDLLATLFVLSATLAYFRGIGGTPGGSRTLWLALSILFFTAALLSKVLTLFLPAAILVCELAFLPISEWRKEGMRLVRLKLLFLIPALIVGAQAVRSVGSETVEFSVEGVTVLQRLSLIFASPWFYLKKLAVPANLSPLYNFPLLPSTWLTAIPILGITAGAIWLARSGRPSVLGAWLAYLILLSPAFLFLTPTLQHTADRHSYLSTIPLFLLAGGGIGMLWKKTMEVPSGRIVQGTLALLLILFAGWHAAIAVRQIRVWENSLTLWSQAVTVAPELPMGYAYLGDAVAKAGNLDDALALYTRATRIDDAYGHAWTRIGIISEMKGDLAGAERAYRRSVTVNPEYAGAYVNLGGLLEARGDTSGALNIYRAGLARKSDAPKLWWAIGEAYLNSGRTDSALFCFERSVVVNPVFAPGEWGIARAKEKLGREAEAKIHLRRAAELGEGEALKRLQSHP